MTTTQIDSDRSLLHIMGLCVARTGGKGWREREGGSEGGGGREHETKQRKSENEECQWKHVCASVSSTKHMSAVHGPRC